MRWRKEEWDTWEMGRKVKMQGVEAVKVDGFNSPQSVIQNNSAQRGEEERGGRVGGCNEGGHPEGWLDREQKWQNKWQKIQSKT